MASVVWDCVSTSRRCLAQVPPNGLVVYTGTIMTDDGKEKKVNIDFEPFKPINTSLYLCDNKFHTEALNELLESDNKCVHEEGGGVWVILTSILCDLHASVCTTGREGVAGAELQ